MVVCQKNHHKKPINYYYFQLSVNSPDKKKYQIFIHFQDFKYLNTSLIT